MAVAAVCVVHVAAAMHTHTQAQVEDDRAQINAVIQQLDEKKRIALEETWKQVGRVCVCMPVCGEGPLCVSAC
jgi:hypothetical protein